MPQTIAMTNHGADDSFSPGIDKYFTDLIHHYSSSKREGTPKMPGTIWSYPGFKGSCRVVLESFMTCLRAISKSCKQREIYDGISHTTELTAMISLSQSAECMCKLHSPVFPTLWEAGTGVVAFQGKRCCEQPKVEREKQRAYMAWKYIQLCSNPWGLM